MVQEASHVLALGAAAMVLACLSFMGGLNCNSAVAWTLRLLAWALLGTVILAAP